MSRSMLYLLALLFGLTAAAISTEKPSSWSDGQPASATSQVLIEIEPVAIELPAYLADYIQGDTALFYFSPTCPHCQAVMPEINALQGKSDLGWVGIAVASSSDDILKIFNEEYQPQFPIVRDTQRAFSTALGAQGTPYVYIVSPAESGGYLLKEAYTPFGRGYGAILMLRYAASQGLNPFHYFQGYQGNRVCGACHVQESLSWSTTHHAQAYYTLYKRDRADDPECVACHVVGLGEEGGFQLGDHGSSLTDVGCESCHTPSGPHDGAYSSAASSCEGCHNKEHSINFSIEKGLPHIDHYISNTLSDKELRERIEAISQGKAERPLLAFNEEETVGAQKCQECHQDVHPQDPHTTAYLSLTRKQKKKGACVSCHSTPKKLGPRSKDKEDYRHNEGVGCESCHGSGKAHIEEPSLDNIVRLGESCPECVLEALCTSCHTEEWDKEWDLHKRLTFYRGEEAKTPTSSESESIKE